MVKQIVKDTFFLRLKSEPATEEDIEIARDLSDTLSAHADGCVGMAANMIGKNKRIIAFFDMDSQKRYLMFNPEITSKNGEYTACEGCLSLTGTSEAKRFKNITVRFQDENMKSLSKSFSGFTAQIIQHEIDHLNGILI